MQDALHIAAIWLHILGIALFVGPQFFLAFAWVPTSRGITDLPTRVKAMRKITSRFGWIGGTGLVCILIAGIYLIATWRTFYHVDPDVGFNSIRFGVIFSIKMTVLLVMLIILALHTYKVGPNLLKKLEAQANGEVVPEAELRKARRYSMLLSISALTLTLIIMVMGTMLTTTSFSLQ
ncbi:MAG: hypothetical protein ABI305_12195 [Tepidiformaceae bacterium]